MTTLKAGDCLGLTTGNEVISLWVKVAKITGTTEIEGLVINGCWSFLYDWKTGISSWGTPTGNQTANDWKIAYKGAVPSNKRSYNDAIAWMNEHIQKPWIVRHTYELHRDTLASVRAFKKRVKDSCSAFMLVWRGKPLREVCKNTEDDEIPF